MRTWIVPEIEVTRFSTNVYSLVYRGSLIGRLAARGEEETRPVAQGEGGGATATGASANAGGTDGEETTREAGVDVRDTGGGEHAESERPRGLLAGQEAC